MVFVTTQAVTVPRAVFIPPTPGIADAPIQAVAKGTSGNVDAGTITHVSTSVQAQLVNSEDPVNNEQPTTGGTHTEKKVVGQKDVDGAVATLRKSLTTQLDAGVDDPQRLPAGTTAFPEIDTQDCRHGDGLGAREPAGEREAGAPGEDVLRPGPGCSVATSLATRRSSRKSKLGITETYDGQTSIATSP